MHIVVLFVQPQCRRRTRIMRSHPTCPLRQSTSCNGPQLLCDTTRRTGTQHRSTKSSLHLIPSPSLSDVIVIAILPPSTITKQQDTFPSLPIACTSSAPPRAPSQQSSPAQIRVRTCVGWEESGRAPPTTPALFSGAFADSGKVADGGLRKGTIRNRMNEGDGP